MTPEWQKMTKEIILPEQLRLVKPIDDVASDVDIDDLAVTEYFESNFNIFLLQGFHSTT